jgi:hypothetical protein
MQQSTVSRARARSKRTHVLLSVMGPEPQNGDVPELGAVSTLFVGQSSAQRDRFVSYFEGDPGEGDMWIFVHNAEADTTAVYFGDGGFTWTRIDDPIVVERDEVVTVWPSDATGIETDAQETTIRTADVTNTERSESVNLDPGELLWMQACLYQVECWRREITDS